MYCHALSKDAATADPLEIERARNLAQAAKDAGGWVGACGSRLVWRVTSAGGARRGAAKAQVVVVVGRRGNMGTQVRREVGDGGALRRVGRSGGGGNGLCVVLVAAAR